MKEIEVKVLNVDKQKIEEILSQLGAKKIFDDQITTYFFDFEDDRIAQSKKRSEAKKRRQKVGFDI